MNLGQRALHIAAAQAAGAHVDGAHGAVGVLMTDSLQVGVEATLGLDIGMADEVGSIEKGKRADFVFVDDMFNIKKVMLGGELC